MFRFAFFAIALPLSSFGAPKELENCPSGKQHHRAVIRHIESGGIGYEHGYTTLEVFLASDPSRWTVTPFLDGRGHLFDDGRWAANAGIGLRTLWGNRAYGINTYYDYRNLSRLHANQIGAGLETLGELFDFRINGYLPVGAKLSNPYQAEFEAFSGHYMLLSQKYQSAMKGANAEFGFHFGKGKSYDFYAAAGPYYFIGEVVPATWGGKARISGTFKDLLTLEISDSYDRTFHNRFQGEISFNFSLGPKSKVKERGRTCKMANTLNDRMLQSVDRQEIIVADNGRKTSIAIDPATGLPYFFVFVNNTSSSDGTYESPYHSFVQAQDNSSPNDIIYVFPGDGTTRGMNAGITLKASQKFWGSGISHLIQTSAGTISIPAQSSSSPTITNTDFDTSGDAVTLATNNAISGFTITSAGHDGIFGTDAQNLEVSHCTFENTTTFPIEATFSGDVSLSIANNQFLHNENGIVLHLGGTSTVVCANNTFSYTASVSEFPINIHATENTFTAYIENNVFDHNTIGGVTFGLQGGVHEANINVLNNVFTYNEHGGTTNLGSTIVIQSLDDHNTANCSIALEGNIFSNNGYHALYTHDAGSFTNFEATASGNTISDSGAGGLAFNSACTTFTLNATNNSIKNLNGDGVSFIGGSPFTSADITINTTTITNAVNGIALNQGSSTLNLTLENNTITTCSGSGVTCFSDAGFTNMTANITGNAISGCANGGMNGASGISLETYVHLSSTIANNTLSDNLSPGVGLSVLTPMTPPTVCLTLTGNSSSPDPGYSLHAQGGTFNLSPCNALTTGNVGTIEAFGTTSVESCPAGAVCP